jgi:hypothetical protein
LLGIERELLWWRVFGFRHKQAQCRPMYLVQVGLPLALLFFIQGTAISISTQDSINSLPPGNNSARLEVLFQEAKALSSQPIRFASMSGEGALEHQGRTSFSEAETVIEIGATDSEELRENLIAHELFHVILKESDFPYATWIPKGTSDQQLLLEVGEGITGCVNDAEIDRRMAARSFKPEMLSRIEAINYQKPHTFAPSVSHNPTFVNLTSRIRGVERL